MNLKLPPLFFAVLMMLIVTEARAWEVDFSRRRSAPTAPAASAPSSALNDNAQTAPDVTGDSGSAADVDGTGSAHTAATEIIGSPKDVTLPPTKSFSKSLAGLVTRHNVISTVDRQELVILNTGKGFVPNNVRLRQGVHYRLHVVNVNEDKKNVSFIMDAFNQHSATYYGQIKSFNLDPDKEGIFEFECPETSSSGKLVVFGPGNPTQERTVSSEK